ncbi:MULTISPECIES: hypothetical protein [Bacillus cereus group]|uniref:Uncharacterized protein n=1 Tax=Bacillus cereus VD118 TaxID=1053231 RepID=R8QMY9_BACCE|nr:MULTISPECIES: hypothetical protein [Bacillus cereus group]EOP72194.1 hypothetical protein IIQ_00011 [Bacillus cereus VD118]MBJ8095555.1 hypothetical protein [Bacillus cereus]MCQ6360017.1 hypothetical protein [Bacillus cereus]CAH2464478.1 hypothetical protein ACOSJ1_EBGNOMHC_05012 [Bacillus mycoides KBAB4]
MKSNLEVGSIVEDWYSINSKKEYIVSEIPLDNKHCKYVLVGMNGQVYSNKLFNSFKEIETYIHSQDTWELKQVPVRINSQKNWNIKRTYGRNHTLETVLKSFINCFPGRWGMLRDKRTEEEKAHKNNYKGEIVIEKGIVLKVDIQLDKDIKKDSKYWICKAYLNS